MEDSCQLRAALILAGFRLLKNPVMWVLLAALALMAAFILVLWGGLVVECLNTWLPLLLPGIFPAEPFVDPSNYDLSTLSSYRDLATIGVFAVFAILGAASLALLVGLFMAIVYGAIGGIEWATNRWSVVKTTLTILWYLFCAAMVVLAVVCFAWFFADVGDGLGPAAHARFPEVFSAQPFAERYSDPNVGEGVLGGITFSALLAAAAVVGFGVWGIYRFLAHLRRWFAETYFWAWLKGHLCLPVQLTE